ncbi:MAG: sugar kinase [Proteobacteria bacterium]|nr:sugar kinase [Pseudomonadota bacterium]
MLELARAGTGWALGSAGDTLNVAVHLARAGNPVGYLTALGNDPFSDEMLARWAGEGVDTSLVLRDPARLPGLYAISTDDQGERSFAYWREASAARAMFALPGSAAMAERASAARLLVFSLISLAILPDAGREALLALAERVRGGGGQVAFDGNYRARLWGDAVAARHWRDRAIARADIGLPTLEDEAALGGAGDAPAVAAHWQGLGCAEVVVKLGAAGCLLPDGTSSPPPEVLRPVDTSGAGDAFDAGYLDARLKGLPPAEAAQAGHRLAGWTVMRPGAIPAR